MTTYKWFKLFDLAEFLATGLTSRTLTLFLEGLEEKTFLITQGNETAITVDGIFLPLSFNGKNPFWRSGYGVFVDDDAQVWLGLEVVS